MRDFKEVNALDKIYEIASMSDGVIILTYSLSTSPIQDILSKLKPPKKIRIMYSVNSNAQRTILQLKGMERNCKIVEICSKWDRYETSHAKVYLFCKTDNDHINLTTILGSFNLTLQTLKGIEIFGIYNFRLPREFLERNGIGHFVEIFNFEGRPKFDIKSLKQSILGKDKEIGYEILLLLLQLWFPDIPIIRTNSTFENVNFFGKRNNRMFVSTYGANTLLARLKDLLRSAFIYANEVGEEVELIIVTPFHTPKGIMKLFLMKDQILENIGLEKKVRFSLKLLTNSFNVSGKIEKSSFSDPGFLRKMMFESKYSSEFQVKFWGYTPGNENFIHAKIYVIRVGDRRAFLLTSANLTLAGLGLEQKNLEVGVIENQPEYTEEVCNWVYELWESEYTIRSREDKIWNELQNWYSKLEETEEKNEEDFEIEGLKEFYIYEKNVLRVRDKKRRKIEFMKLMMSFPRKEKPIRNLEKFFKKKEDWFYVDFDLKEEHLGPVFCDIFAKLTDGTYIIVTQGKINVVERPPKIEIHLLPRIDGPKNLYDRAIPVEVEIEVGKGISEIDLTKLSFELQTGKERIVPEILLMKEKIGRRRRVLHILLWTEIFELTDNVILGLIYKNERKVNCRIPISFLQNIFKKKFDEKVASFLKNRSVRLLTDKRVLCPKIETEFEVCLDSDTAELLGLNQLIIFRDFMYSELIGTEKIRKQIIDKVKFNRKIKLSNNVRSYPPVDVEAWVFGVKKDLWTLWVPLGKVNYRLFKNPPDLEIVIPTSIKTNVTPVEINFGLKGDGALRDQIIVNYEIGKSKNKVSTQSSYLECDIPKKVDLCMMEKGIDLHYRFVFKYNTADIAGKIHINYDFFVSAPHPYDPTKVKMLICDFETPSEFLNKISNELCESKRPYITVIPMKTTDFKEFQLRPGKNSYKETESEIVFVKNNLFALKRFGKEIVDELKRKNIVTLEIILFSKDSNKKVTIPIDIMYLEGVETDSLPMRKGGYGRTITIYHPDQYKYEFKEDIIKIIRLAYRKHLHDYHINRIRKGEYSWIIPKYKREGVIGEILSFMKRVKSEEFIPNFKPKKMLGPPEIFTLSGRKVIDFILFIRRKKHQLKIKIKEM